MNVSGKADKPDIRHRLDDDFMVRELMGPLMGARDLFRHDFRYRSKVLLVSLLASVEKRSVESVCRLLDGVTARTVRHWLATLSLDGLERYACDLLRMNVVERLRRCGVELSVDITDIPYYGLPSDADDSIRRGKPRQGTSRFHSYITVYAWVRNHRYTIAMGLVRRGERTADALARIMDDVLGLGLHITCVYLDKEFYQGSVIGYLKNRDIPFVIAVPERGDRIKSMYDRSKGTRTMWWELGNGVTFLVQVYQHYMKGSKTRGGGCTWFSYATYGRPKNPKKISGQYRKRFGIESTYRMKNRCRARSCTRNPAVRFFNVLLSFLVVNFKVNCEWKFRTDGRTSRRNSTATARLDDVRVFLRRVLEALIMYPTRRRRFRCLRPI